MAHADRLRRNVTDAEKKLWAAVRNKQINGIKFRRQQAIGPYIADFLSHAPALIIELDGGQHAMKQDQDAVRTAFLERAGYRVLRFWNHEVIENLPGVLQVIAAVIEGFEVKKKMIACAARTPTLRFAPPSPAGGGGEVAATIAALPPLRGKLRPNAELASTNWFRVGGPADLLFRPEDADDLADFLRGWAGPVLPLGVGSNLIIRDGGIEGAVIRLGRGFTQWGVEGDVLEVGAGMLCAQAAEIAMLHELGGLEFLCGIPGAVGGACAMNAGAYGAEIKDVMVEAEIVTRQGEIRRITPAELRYEYRQSPGLPEGAIFTRAWLRGVPETRKATIRQRMEAITEARATTQPIRARTGGSTFKNPPLGISGGKKAWQLIDEAGCRGLRIGDAQMSELHCNFMLNLGNATAAELEALGEEVIRRVAEHSGEVLRWEIKRVGRKA